MGSFANGVRLFSMSRLKETILPKKNNHVFSDPFEKKMCHRLSTPSEIFVSALRIFAPVK